MAILVAAVWGLNFIAVKWAVQDFPPLLANSLRFAGVFLVFLPFLKKVPGRMPQLLSMAFLMGVVHFGVMFLAISISDGVGAVAVAAQLTVPFSTILAIIFLKESVGWKRVTGVAISFGGVLVIGFDPVVFTYWHGLALMSLAAFIYSASAIMMRSLKEVAVTTVQAWVGLIGMTGSLLLSWLFENGQIGYLAAASSEGWLGILFNILGSSVIGHGLANYLFSRYEVSVVAPYFLIVPLFAVTAGVLLLDEEVTIRLVTGGALTIVGVLVVTLRNRVRATKADDATAVIS
ncbi:MAG: EamA family transporter [Kordiimonadaceae bacterium]|nr:EamA family transporter [Kordiimonadaceae bacterium]